MLKKTRQSLSFVKDEHTYGKKMAWKGCTKVIYKGTFILNRSLSGLYTIRKPIFGYFQTICSFDLTNMWLDLWSKKLWWLGQVFYHKRIVKSLFFVLYFQALFRQFTYWFTKQRLKTQYKKLEDYSNHHLFKNRVESISFDSVNAVVKKSLFLTLS